MDQPQHASYSLFSQTFGIENIFRYYNRIATYNYTQAFEYSGLEDHRLTLGGDFNWMQTIFTNEQTVAKLKRRDYDRLLPEQPLRPGPVDRWASRAHRRRPALLVLDPARPVPGAPRSPSSTACPREQSLDFHTGYYVQYLNSINFADQENLNEFYYPAKKVDYRTVNPSTSLLLLRRLRRREDPGRMGLHPGGLLQDPEPPHRLRPRGAARFPAGTGGPAAWATTSRRPTATATASRSPSGAPKALLFGGLSYSNGTSVIREDNSDEAFFPRWHQPHSFKADLAINWRGKDGIWNTRKRGRYFRSSTTLKYATGLPYTEDDRLRAHPPPGPEPGPAAPAGPIPNSTGDLDTVNGNRNAAFVPAYLRWDAKVVDWGREGKWNFSWTLLNLTDHENIFFYSYDRQTNPPKRVEITQFPFFPMLVNYEYNF